MDVDVKKSSMIPSFMSKKYQKWAFSGSFGLKMGEKGRFQSPLAQNDVSKVRIWSFFPKKVLAKCVFGRFFQKRR